MTRRALLLGVVFTAALGVGGAQAVPFGHTADVTVQRAFELWNVDLLGGGSFSTQYGTSSALDSAGPAGGLPSAGATPESTRGFLHACYGRGCIFSDLLAWDSPAVPLDPLLLGGDRLMRMIVESGPAGCVGTTVTVTLKMTPTSPIGLSTPFAYGSSPLRLQALPSVGRSATPSGSVNSCLGIVGIVGIAPPSPDLIGGIYNSAPLLVTSS